MESSPMNDRNNALEFVRRAKKNLDAIEEMAAQDPDRVHRVTQLVMSLLGLVVFPEEKLLLEKTKSKRLVAIKADGWLAWTITRDDVTRPTHTLDDLVRHLRNAVAHGRVCFSSDRKGP